jgi:diguanylate cyclase (GGDEF)-like protein/PAS domain S-box-containing protein
MAVRPSDGATDDAETPSSASLLQIDHVQLAMPSGREAVRAAEEFYGEVLGLRRVPAPVDGSGDGCWFEGPTVKLHLGTAEPSHEAGTVHPALLVEDLDGLVQRIETAGGEPRLIEDYHGMRLAQVHDPFGNLIEFMETYGPTPAMFRVMAEESIHPLALIDRRGIVRWIGRSVERFFGYRPEQLIGTPFDRLLAPESRKAARKAFATIDDAYRATPWGGVGVRVDLRRGDDGSVVTCELAALTIHRSGLPWYVIVIRQASYEAALDQMIEAMASGTDVCDILPQVVQAIEHMVPRTGVVVGHEWTDRHFSVSEGATDLLLDEAGTPWAIALDEERDVFVDQAALPDALAKQASVHAYAACWVHPVTVASGARPRAAIILWRPHPGPPTEFTWNTIRRAGQLLRLTLQWDHSRRNLEFAATHDALTGVGNLWAFRERLQALREGGEGQNAVFYIDLDRFKPVNDTLGHQAGDRALAEVATRLHHAVRPGDMVARVGGDEFAVLCERLGALDDAERVADRLLEVIRRPINLAPDAPATHEVRLDASIGVVVLTDDEPVDALLGQADQAMRGAKRSGRGRWAWG